MKTIVVSTQKGGVGKSTLACHIAFYYAEKDKRVLFINCETQNDSSRVMCAAFGDRNLRTDLLFTRDLFSLPECGPGQVVVMSGGASLGDVNKDAGGLFAAQLQRFDQQFDVCVIDVPPTANVLQIAPLTVPGCFVISPIEMEDFSIEGGTKQMQTIKGVQARFNPGLTYLGMMPSRLVNTSKSQRDNLKELLTKFPQYVFATHLDPAPRISQRPSIPAALHEGKPVWKMRNGKEAGLEMLAVMDAIDEKVRA